MSSTKTVRIRLRAMTAAEYTEAILVPSDMSDDDLWRLMRDRYTKSVGKEFVMDREFWERGDCTYIVTDPDDHDFIPASLRLTDINTLDVEQIQPPEGAPSILATYHRQAWSYQRPRKLLPVESFHFDCTAHVLQMPLTAIHEIQDFHPSSYLIGWISVALDGPFSVECTNQICQYFNVESVKDIDLDMLNNMRDAYGIRQEESPQPRP